MDVATFNYRLDLMDAAKSRELLNDVHVATYPNMSDQNRRKFYKQIDEKAYPRDISDKKVYTSKEAFDAFKGIMNGRR